MIQKSFFSIISKTQLNHLQKINSPINTTNKFFKLDSKGYEEEQLKGHGRKSSQPQLSPLDNIAFPFPFEWTLQSSNYKYYDPRFTEQPIRKNLQSSEKEHIEYVLQNLEGFLNSSTLPVPHQPKQFSKAYTQQSLKRYLHQSLSSKLQTFLESLKSSQISIKLHIIKDSITKTQGYMEMQAKNIDQSDSINFISPKFFHQYNFQREKQLLFIEEKKKKQKKSQEELLKEDVKDMIDEKSSKKDVRQFFDTVQKQKASDSQRAANFLMSKLRSLANKKPQKKREQEKCATSELIKGRVHFKVFYKNNLICDEQTDLHSKWMYVVEKNEPESVKKSRKRILYDFQFWNRGSFFEVKDWTKEMSV